MHFVNKSSRAPLNNIQYHPEVVLSIVLYYYRFKVSLGNVADLMELRALGVAHRTFETNDKSHTKDY